MKYTETIQIFSKITTYVAIVFTVFMSVQAYFFLSTPLPLWPKILFSLLVMPSIILIFSFKSAQICITDKGILYASGWVRKKILYREISTVQILHEKDFPKIAYKLWAYYAFGEKNGLFKLESGRKAYICGTSSMYLHIVTQNFEAIFAIGKKGLSEETVQKISLKIKE